MFETNQDEILLESGTNEVEFLVVEVGGQLFGINVAKIKSIQQYNAEDITPIPDAPESIIGMFRERNDTITLIDLAVVLHKEITEEISREIVIVSEFNNEVRSFKVQGVKRIYRISWEDFTPINDGMPVTSHVTGSVFIDGNEIMILDLEQIVVQIFPEMEIIGLDEDIVNKKDKIDRGQLKVLFAEDSNLIRSTLSRELKKAGFSDLRDFENGQLLYDYYVKNRDEILENNQSLLILTDVEMPKMDGLTLTRRVREKFPNDGIPVVIFSSLINTQMIEKCKTVGADRFIAKPSYNELIEVIDEFCVSR